MIMYYTSASPVQFKNDGIYWYTVILMVCSSLALGGFMISQFLLKQTTIHRILAEYASIFMYFHTQNGSSCRPSKPSQVQYTYHDFTVPHWGLKSPSEMLSQFRLAIFLCEIHPDILQPQMKALPPLCHQQSPHKSYKREPMEVTAWWIADSDETPTANMDRVGMLKGNPWCGDSSSKWRISNEGHCEGDPKYCWELSSGCKFLCFPQTECCLPSDWRPWTSGLLQFHGCKALQVEVTSWHDR